VIGVVLVAIASLDVFQTLFQPAGRGALSDWSAQLVWRLCRKAAVQHRGILSYAGPLAMLLIIISWATFMITGFALVYLPHMGDQYIFDAGVNPTNHRGFWEAVSSSIGAMITLSQGMEPKSEWLGLTRGVEAIIGFGLLTASVSWLLSIYPVLEARRSLAQRASLLHNAEVENGIDLIQDGGDQVQNWLIGLASDLASLRNQMSQFPITFYFYVGEAETALAGALPYLNRLAERAVAANSAVLKLAGTALGGSVSDFSTSLAKEFLRVPTRDTNAIIRAYASEHLTEMMD
jgi:hypothetical protein